MSRPARHIIGYAKDDRPSQFLDWSKSTHCCICLEQFAGDRTFIAVTTSFPQKIEDWTFCPVLQLFCLRNVSLYWLLCDPTLLLRVLAVLGLYATLSQFVIIIIIIIIIITHKLNITTTNNNTNRQENCWHIHKLQQMKLKTALVAFNDMWLSNVFRQFYNLAPSWLTKYRYS